MDVLDRCDEAGVGVELDGGRLRVLGLQTAPRELADDLRAARDEVVAVLEQEKATCRPSEGRAWVRCETCGWVGGGPVERIEYLATNHRALGHRVAVRR